MTVGQSTVLDRPPSKLKCYWHGAVRQRPDFNPGAAMPHIGIARPALRLDAGHLAKFERACGWDISEYMPFIYPLALLFHYHIAIFGHPRFPCSQRTLLGIRQHAVQRRRVGVGETLDLDVRMVAQRVLAKGVEFDVRTTLARGGDVAWECISVYYLRGNFGGSDSRAVADRLGPLANPEFEARWQAPRGGGFAFARLSGDFNPAHFSSRWARMIGFKRDFAHTQRAVSDCLHRLPDAARLLEADSLRLDVAFKGPIYYGSSLLIKGAQQDNGYRFDLYCDDGDKPAIPGSIQRVRPDERLGQS